MSANHFYIKKLILKAFPNKKMLNIVDYGCGSGKLLEFIPINRIKNYTGYDINRKSIENAKKEHKAYNFKDINKSDLPSLGAKNSIDVVVLVGVIQYLKQSETNFILKEAGRVLSKNGILVISCAIDHKVYKFFNLYQLFVPNHFINKKSLLKQISKVKLSVIYKREKGILIAPLFSNIFSLFFDSIDRIFYKTKGTLGPIGILVRRIIRPIIQLEYNIPIDFGYTLYVVGKKKK